MKLNLIANKEEITKLHKEISAKVKFYRKEKKISQLDLATEMGFSSSTFFGNAEANREGKHFSIEHLYLIAKRLNICICSFLPHQKNCPQREVKILSFSDKKNQI